MNTTGTSSRVVLGVSLALLSLLFTACPGLTEPEAETEPPDGSPEEPPDEPCLSRPCAVDDFYQVARNSVFNEFYVLVNDLNFDGHTGGGNLSITEVTSATSGMVTITGNATTVTYTPDPDFVDQDAFTYTIVDTAYAGDGPSTATVTVDVQP